VHEVQVVFGNPFIGEEVDGDLYALFAKRPVNPPAINGLYLAVVDEHALRPAQRVKQMA
jgi:hypothetical protein